VSSGFQTPRTSVGIVNYPIKKTDAAFHRQAKVADPGGKISQVAPFRCEPLDLIDPGFYRFVTCPSRDIHQFRQRKFMPAERTGIETVPERLRITVLQHIGKREQHVVRGERLLHETRLFRRRLDHEAVLGVM
jgi:hypothetical protein